VAAFCQQTGGGGGLFPPVASDIRVGEVPPANGFCVFERQDVTDDFLLAYQVTQKHVVGRIAKNMAYSKYGFRSSLDGLLDLQTIVQASCLEVQVRMKHIAFGCKVVVVLSPLRHGICFLKSPQERFYILGGVSVSLLAI
jgi:hypothetical protein